jgi:3-oxoacyl-[acyl-carrier protein] reductase
MPANQPSANQSPVSRASTPLEGRVALVTGVSRKAGIALAVANRLHNDGATVIATGWQPHDDAMPWGSDPADAPFLITEHNMADPLAPISLIDEVMDTYGRLDIVVAVHAQSSASALNESTAAELDSAWAVNVRSVVLLAQRFAQVHTRTDDNTGRMLWFTSGQALGPMPNEMPYAITKGALHAMTQTLAQPLIDAGIAANCINPGPVDTGWAPKGEELHQSVAAMFPSGRWGTATDVANLVSFLVSDQGAWIVGQVLNSEGGFRRFQ